jgi:hypothetical protein
MALSLIRGHTEVWNTIRNRLEGSGYNKGLPSLLLIPKNAFDPSATDMSLKYWDVAGRPLWLIFACAACKVSAVAPTI